MNSMELFGVSTLTVEMDKLQPLLEHYGLAALFFANLPAGCGIPFPGWPLLLACAALAAKGQHSITAVLLTAWIATQLGNMAGYLIGRRGIRQVLERLSKQSTHFARVENFCGRYGAAFLIAAPFIEGLREMASLAAGALRMPWPRFLWGSMAGTTVWALVWGLGAYYLGENAQRVGRVFHDLRPHAWALTIMLLLGVAGFLIYEWRKLRRTAAPVSEE